MTKHEALAVLEAEVAADMSEAGRAAASEVGLYNLPQEALDTLGRLKFRYSYGQNQLAASIETSKIAGKIAATLIPWNVGTISMWTALTALEDNRDLEKKVKYNNRQVAFIIKMLENIPGLISFPSRANFILFDAGPAGYKGADIIEFATKRGIILRGEKTQYGSDGWFRVTIGTEKENQKFVGLIRDFFSFNNSKKNRLKQ